MQDKFNALIAENEADLIRNNKSFNIVGYIKLIFVLIIVVLGYGTAAREFPLELIVLFIAAFTVLAGLWVYHERLHKKIDFSKGILSICNRQIDRITGKWTAFKDIGAEFINQDHPYACDLDIVGQKSIFQFLNTTNTWHGRQAFAGDLLRPEYSCSELEKRQEAISELSCDIEFLSKAQYYFSRIGVDSSAVKLVEELKDDASFMNSKALKMALTVMPLLTVLFIAGIFIFQQKSLYMFGLLMVVVQAVLWLAGMARLNKYLGVMANAPYKLSAYGDVIELLKDKGFGAEKLTDINRQLRVASQAINDLGKIANKVSVKHNVIIYFIANVFLLWDYES